MIAAFSIHRMLLRAALSSALLFAWVLLYELELSLTGTIQSALAATALIFALSQAVLILATPLSAKLNEHGMVRSMILALCALAAAFALLGVAFLTLSPLSIALFGILAGIYRAFYAIPLALMRDDLSVARQAVEVVIASIPAVAGIVLAGGYEAWVLIAGSALALASIIPLLRFEAYERFEWTYRETFGMLIEPAHRRYVKREFLRGIEAAALFALWPLFLFVIVVPSYAALGVIASGSLLLVLSVRALVQRPLVADPAARAALTGGAWVARLAVGGPIAAIVVETTHHAGVSRHMPTHDAAADRGTFLDEVTALKEVALGFGRLSLALIFALALAFASPAYAFGFAFIVAAASAAAGEYLASLREETL